MRFCLIVDCTEFRVADDGSTPFGSKISMNSASPKSLQPPASSMNVPSLRARLPVRMIERKLAPKCLEHSETASLQINAASASISAARYDRQACLLSAGHLGIIVFRNPVLLAL